jgi:hypothetical protein
MRRILFVALGAASALAASLAAAQEGPPPPRRMPAPEEVFKTWDGNGDGVVDKAEWVAAKRPEDRFAMIDADKDGRITLDEMKAAFETMRQRRMRQGDAPPPPPPPESN